MNIYSDAIEQLGIFTIVGGILAIVATVLAYVFIVPEKRREKLNAFGKFLHDTCNFKYLIVEKILQALYFPELTSSYLILHLQFYPVSEVLHSFHSIQTILLPYQDQKYS